MVAKDAGKDRRQSVSGKSSEFKKSKRHDIGLYLTGRLLQSDVEISLFPTEFVFLVHATHTNDDQNIVGKN